MGNPTFDDYGNPIETNISDSADNTCPTCASLRSRLALADRLISGVLLSIEIIEETDDGEAWNLRVTSEELHALRAYEEG